MKQHILSALLISGAALCADAQVTIVPGDRIDAYSDAETFKSILVDDIMSITYEGDPLAGYTHVVINTYSSGILKFPIDDLHRLAYSSVNSSPHEIRMITDDHSQFRLFLNFNDPDSPDPIDPDKPYGWRGGVVADPVFFLPVAEKGFRSQYSIRGIYSGYDYTSVRNFVMEVSGDFTSRWGIGLDCLMYFMPFEPVEMTIQANEINDYAGLDILGTYTGARLNPEGGKLISGASDDASLELKANTTLNFISNEGDNPISQLDCFSYDPEKRSFAYVPDLDDVNKNPIDLNVLWGVSGEFRESGLTFVQAVYMPDAVTSNNRRYVMARNPFTYNHASIDAYGMRSILEVIPQTGDPVYTLLEGYGSSFTDLTAEFVEGKSMADIPSKAYFSVAGKRRYRYTIGNDANPVIILKGDEEGTYSGANGDLILDGFGDGRYRDQPCTYVVEGASINLIDASGEVIESVIIDTANHTYKVKAAAKWEGPKMFTTDAATASCKGQDEQDFATVTLTLDKNINGQDAPGNAIVFITIPGEDSRINNQGEYVYDDIDRTITVSNIPSYIHVSDTGDIYEDFSYARRKYVFHISEDGKSAWLGSENLADKLYLNRAGSYVLTGQSCTLKAEGADDKQPADITGTYSGVISGKHERFDMDIEADMDLTLTEDEATLSVAFKGAALLSFTGEYTFEDSVLTLKGVDVGNGDKFSGITVKADIAFNFADGVLTGIGSYYGSGSTGCAISLDFSSFSASRN